jgi:hypothetical protein
VSAAFLTATGELQIAINDTDTATIGSNDGDIVITDQNGAAVPINIDRADKQTVNRSDIRALQVRGDAAPDQAIILDTFLVPSNGLTIDAEIEKATINESVTFVTDKGINIGAGSIILAADLEASELGLVFGGDVAVQRDVKLTASDVTFRGSVDDDGDDTTGSSIVIDASGTTRFEGAIGATQPIGGLVTDAAGNVELHGDVYATGGTILFNDRVLLAGNVTIGNDSVEGIHFNRTLDSQADGHFDLTLSAPTGKIGFSGNIGTGNQGDQRLGDFTVGEAAGGVSFGEQRGLDELRTEGSINIGSLARGIGGAGVVFAGGPSGPLKIGTAGKSVRVNGEVQLQTDVAVSTEGGTVTFTADAPIDSEPNSTRQLEINAGSGSVFSQRTIYSDRER